MAQPTAEQTSVKSSFARAVSPSSQPTPTPVAAIAQQYQEAELSIASENPKDLYQDENLTLLHQQIKHLVKVEAPIHQKEVIERIAKESWGFKKITQKVRECISEQIQQLHRQKQIYQKGDFIWRDRAEPSNWEQFRNFTGKTGTIKLEQIAPEEIAAAMIHVIGLSLSMLCSTRHPTPPKVCPCRKLTKFFNFLKMKENREAFGTELCSTRIKPSLQADSMVMYPVAATEK